MVGGLFTGGKKTDVTAVRLMLPPNPKRLVSVIVDVVFWPARTSTNDGFAVTVKSGGGGLVTETMTVTA